MCYIQLSAGAGRRTEEVCIYDHRKEQIVLVAGPKVFRIGDFDFDSLRCATTTRTPKSVSPF
jgi:hypothetical protein